jgi:cephalosporin-C deacetylase-like acetyl esterase
MYLRDKRAADYLVSRPDWNGKVLVAMGFSMGGQQSFAAAGLDPRITHVIVEVPAGADFDGPLHGRAAGYPNWPGNNAPAMETGLYFDIVNFAARVKATTFLAMGFRDTIASPVGDWITFNQAKGPKEIAAMALAGHNNQSTRDEQKLWYDISEQWLNTLVHGGEVKPEKEVAIIQ